MIALMKKYQSLLPGAGFLLLLVLAAALPVRADAKHAGESNTSSAVEPAAYAGADACMQCHEDVYKKQFENTPHFKTTLSRGHGCESCHGPGAEHVAGGGDVEKIVRFAKLSREETSKRCLACHQYGEEHANFARSQHNANDVTCTGCHSVHHAKEAQYLLVQKQPQLCYSCHTEIKPDFAKPFRHRVDQGLVTCGDCHNQHGGFLTRQLRSTAAQDQVCFKCHTDKAGPFTFEHEPVKTEGCVACHQPHGSVNPRLLKRTQVNLLCLECHTLSQDQAGGAPGLPSFHNQSQKYQACTMCHATIHGSNFDRMLFK